VGEGVRYGHFAFCSECKIELIDLKIVKPEFSDTLDELVGETQKQIIKSLWLLWAITQQQSVVPKIKATIESVLSFCSTASDCADIRIGLARKVRLNVYFCLCIHQGQGYWRGLSTSFKLTSGGSLEKWFKVIHKDIVTYIHCLLYIFAISQL
jgi:hypothetical protein